MFFSAFIWKTSGPDASEITIPKRLRTSRPNFSFPGMDNRKIKMDNKKKLSVYAELSKIPKTTLFTTLQYGT